MSRYVDIEGDWVDDAVKAYSLGYYEYDEYAIPFEALGSAPSIDLVRCKECIFADEDKEAEMCRCLLVSFPLWNRSDHFCSDGKRGDGNEKADQKTEPQTDCADTNLSEKPTGSTISKMEQVEPQTCSFSDCDNFKNPDYERCIECKRKQIKLKTEQTERSSE